VSTVLWLVFVAGAWLVVDARTSRVVVAYVVLAGTVTALTVPSSLMPSPTVALFFVSLALKLIVAPVGLLAFAGNNPAARNLRPALILPIRLVAVLGIGAIARGVPHLESLSAFPQVAVAAYVILCGLAVLTIDRNLLGQLVGLLVLSSGIELAGAIVAPGLPATIELGAAFDALVVTFIGLALVRAFLAHNPLLDVESLRSLRG
jgi:hydrogenase-4 membrane subunit HyfE